MTTEAQAKQKKRCPGIPHGKRPKCIGSDCMGWIWLEPHKNGDQDHGYCGLTSHGPHPYNTH